MRVERKWVGAEEEMNKGVWERNGIGGREIYIREGRGWGKELRGEG